MSFDELAFKANLKQITSEENQQQKLAEEFYKKALDIKGVQSMDVPKTKPKM